MPTLAPAADLESLLTGLQQSPPLSQSFHEVRFRRALKTPLVTSGTLSWKGGLEFERHVRTPYEETGVVSGRTLVIRRGRGAERVIPLARAPELQVLFGGLSALFAGDATLLRENFDVELQGDQPWRLLLRPKQAVLRERVPELELRGSDANARCLVLRQPGAETLTVFDTDTAPATSGDFDVVVDAACAAP